ncbi:hypothetical protein [Spirochaeta africana]|nr:hypothetical protein [Spirochaeta africana]
MIRIATASAVILSLLTMLPLQPPLLARPADQEQQLRERLQSHLEPESTPPPGTEQIRSGVFSILGGTGLGSIGVWVSLQGLEYRAEAIELYQEYQDLGYLDDPDAFDDAWKDYRNTELKGIALRASGAAATGTGIYLVIRGMMSIYDAARQSQELADEMGVDPAAARSQAAPARPAGVLAGQLLLEPRGLSLVWRY